MSATLDFGPIANLLGDAPIITSSGKAFPVEERFISAKRERTLTDQIIATVETALNETAGDILVFLPGAGEIRSCAEALRPVVEHRKDGATLHPLYGDLPFEEQERALLPAHIRKIVLATNIAETSLTIEGVRVVIDSGLTRRLQYDPSTGMNRLITTTVSKASAEQRKGRAGRLGPGVCYRLYGRHAFQSMMPFSPPEILVSDLSSLVLDLAAWGVKEPSRLSWLDLPPAGAWDAAKNLLRRLGALDPCGSITTQGRAMARFPLHPRLARLLLRAGELGCVSLGADLAALLSERDIIRCGMSRNMINVHDPEIDERLGILRSWRKGSGLPAGADSWALRAVDRTSIQLLRLMHHIYERQDHHQNDHDAISRLLLCAFPDRIARRRDDKESSFVLVQGRGVRFASISVLSKSPFIVAAHMDAGAKGEGVVHMAASLTEEIIREECTGSIETIRRVEWDGRESRIIASVEERLGVLLLSAKPFTAADEEVVPILCEMIRKTPGMLIFAKESRQFQGRVAFMRSIFPEESWSDLSDEYLLSVPEDWLLPCLGGIRNAQGVAGIDLLHALRSQVSWKQLRLLDERAPTHIIVPSGYRVALDYTSGDIPVLAVKLQEMFGLADTPTIAAGRVKVLLHLLSPARRPVQITRDLKGFWDGSYQQVKKEMKGRYPKHPWPDDPWNTAPTRRAKARA
jgi:ATP-dependent helicase HrpB